MVNKFPHGKKGIAGAVVVKRIKMEVEECGVTKGEREDFYDGTFI